MDEIKTANTSAISALWLKPKSHKKITAQQLQTMAVIFNRTYVNSFNGFHLVVSNVSCSSYGFNMNYSTKIDSPMPSISMSP